MISSSGANVVNNCPLTCVRDVARLQLASAAEPGCTSRTTSMPVRSGARGALLPASAAAGQAARVRRTACNRTPSAGAARDGLTLLDQFERALHAAERQVETRLRPVAAAGVRADDAAADVDDRRAGRTAGRARGGLQVERVEVVVLADAVFGRLAIEARSVPARIDNCSPASLPTTRISVPTPRPSGYSGSACGRM
jgi:hypothetical protein